MTIQPHYSPLSQDELNTLTQLVERLGWDALLAGLGDIVTQHPKFDRAQSLSFALGVARARGRDVDKTGSPSPTLFLIWSFEHQKWWGPDEDGYTDLAGDAGRYPLERALKICTDANVTQRNEALVPDIQY